ncbi:MAG: MBL fold metallo-hydrolase [Pyrinomonadaceae bacterium]
MKKWLIRLGILASVIVAVPVVGLVCEALDHQTVAQRIRNDELPTIKPDWPGNALDQKSRFMDERNPYMPKTRTLLKWTLATNPYKEEKRNDAWQVAVKDPTEFLDGNADGILWLGHASFYIRFGDIGILTDPVFDEPTPLKRLVPVASPLEKIRDVDYVLLSHDHRDHMDEETLRNVAKKFPEAAFLAGLRSEDVLNEWANQSNTIMTAGWFQQFDPSVLANDQVKITFVPVRHWSRRWLFDMNWRLWGGYVIESGDTTIYFGGDSGYAPHYKETGELFPEIDYFLIGIGAYQPRFMMEPNHNSPAEAFRAFQDSGAKKLVPMHYGTFDLSDEPPSQPLRLLLMEAERAGLRECVHPLAINESIVINSSTDMQTR